MGRAYASLADLRNYTGDQSLVVSPRQLRSAALLVERATRHARYTINGSTGQATDPKIEGALRDAMCEVLQHREETGVTSDVSLASLGVQSASIGSASYSLVSGSTPGTYRVLPWDAQLILESAGLLAGPVVVVG